MRLENKVVAITGGGAGLGRESALLFAEEGAKIVVSDVDEQRAHNAAKAVQEHGGSAIGVKADVTVESDVKGLIDAAVEEYGKLDITFANAGIPVPGFGQVPFEETTEETWRKVVDVNFTGVFYAAKHSVPAMKANGGGAIVVTSSAGGLVAYTGFTPYNASKGGVNQLVRSLALELGPFNIRVNAICPTWGMSVNFALEPGAEVMGLSYEEATLAQSGEDWNPANFPGPLKVPRPPRLRDNAYAALWLASDEAAYMSGLLIPTCDGGTLSRVASNLPTDEMLGTTLPPVVIPEA